VPRAFAVCVCVCEREREREREREYAFVYVCSILQSIRPRCLTPHTYALTRAHTQTRTHTYTHTHTHTHTHMAHTPHKNITRAQTCRARCHSRPSRYDTRSGTLYSRHVRLPGHVCVCVCVCVIHILYLYYTDVCVEGCSPRGDHGPTVTHEGGARVRAQGRVGRGGEHACTRAGDRLLPPHSALWAH